MNRVCPERNLIGFTQEELADALKVDKSTVCRWEAGGRIPQDKLIAMRNLFHCDIDWILGVTNTRTTI